MFTFGLFGILTVAVAVFDYYILL